MKLSNKEYNVLNKLAKRSGIDCWFELRSTNKYDYAFDREENKRIKLKDAICLLDSGLTELNDYNLTREETECYKKILNKLKENEI